MGLPLRRLWHAQTSRPYLTRISRPCAQEGSSVARGVVQADCLFRLVLVLGVVSRRIGTWEWVRHLGTRSRRHPRCIWAASRPHAGTPFKPQLAGKWRTCGRLSSRPFPRAPLDAPCGSLMC